MPSSSSPLISIVVPTYEMKGQGLSFLKRCLASIKGQVDVDPKTIEIVVSDHSHNEIIEHFCNKQAGAIKYRRITTKRGIAAHNLNMGIAHAIGQYVKILFQDDLLVENYHLAKIIEVIKSTESPCILTGALHTTDGHTFINPITPKDNPYFLFGNNTVSSPSVMTLKRELANQYLFDEKLKMLFDCDLYYRLFENCRNIKIIDNIYVANGIWDGQAQHQINAKQFTKEVRYLNWKYPQASMTDLLPKYKAEFLRLHPDTQLPFLENINLSLAKKIFLQLITK